MKGSWQTITRLVNKPIESTTIASLKESNKTTFDKQSISNKMNEHFCSIGEKFHADIVHTSNPLLLSLICSSYPKKHTVSQMTFNKTIINTAELALRLNVFKSL